MTFLQKKKSK